jgi:hypothetical protein
VTVPIGDQSRQGATWRRLTRVDTRSHWYQMIPNLTSFRGSLQVVSLSRVPRARRT